MNIDNYNEIIENNGFNEFPSVIGADTVLLDSFVDYSKADLDLRIHLATVILNRNFSSADGNMVLTDQFWLVNNFLQSYQKDHIRPWLTETIREAMTMIVVDHGYTQNKIGTTFMFGIIEFYAKYLLGWRPLSVNFFDNDYHDFSP